MTKTLTQGNPAKLIFLFAMPLIIGNIFQQFYSMADTLIVGRTIGVNALAAVGCTGSITFFIIGFVNGLTSGLSIITAQKFGSGNEHSVRKSFAAGIIISSAAAMIFTVWAVLLARPLLVLLQTPTEIIDDAYQYLVTVFMGIPATILFNLLSNVVRALGDSKTPLYFLIFACLVNIVLDFIFILNFHMGVAGAGLATILAQLLSGMLCILFIVKKIPILWIKKEDFHVHPKIITSHLAVALPMAFQMSIIAIGSLMVQFALNGLGSIYVASYTASQKIDSIATLPMSSFGTAIATYTAQNYGAGKFNRIRKGVFQCILISGSFSLVMGFVNIFAGSQLTSLFVGAGETEILALSRTFLTITGSMYLVLALLFIYRSALQGLGKSLFPTVSGIMELIMRAVGALILTRFFGFAGTCSSNPLAWIGACIPLAIAYYLNMKHLPKQDLENTP